MLQSILDEYKSMTIEKRNWLKSLKDKMQPQPQPKWSEEDEETLDYIIAYIEKNKSEDIIYTKKTEVLEGMVAWLKSLKDRYTWKPSDEQMNTLLSEVEGWTKGCPKQIVLESLYNDLNKLREE